MILDRLTLDGFRLHRQTDVAFGPGLTAIVGTNGAGKSTLVEAVAFALFGEQRGTKETLRGDDGSPYRARLEFRLGDVSYVVERRPDRAFLAQGERRIAEGLADTTRACIRLLGLSYEQFRNSFLAEQKGLAFLRFRTATARQEEVSRMLGLDRLGLAENKAAEARRTAAAEARALEATVGDEAAIRASHREAEEAAKRARAEVRSASAEFKRAEEENAKAEPGGKAAETYLALQVAFSKAEEAARLAAATWVATLAALKLAEAEAAEAATLAFEAARHGELLAARPGVVASERATQEAEALDPGGKATVEEATQALAAAQSAWQSRREAAVAERAAAREALRHAQADRKAAEAGDDGAPCPVCGRPLGAESHAWRRELEERERAARERLALAEKAAVEEPPEELSILEKRRRAAELRRSATAKTDLRSLDEEVARLAPLAARAATLVGSERRLRDAAKGHDAAQTEARRTEEEARATAANLKVTGVLDAAAARSALARAAAARAAFEATGAALKTAQTSLEAAERAQTAAEARLQEARARRDALRVARHQETLNAAVATEMRALRTLLNGALRPELEARAGELLERMTAGRYRRLKLGADFEPTVVDDDTDRAVLSGGEEDVVALALRLALAELVQDRQGHSLTLLMLDEAFGALDAERRQSLLDVLVGLRDRYEQVIVVSHVEEVSQVADRVLRVRRDATGAARVEEG